MKTVVINVSDCYKLHVNTWRVNDLENHLEIKSQWTGAKDGEALQNLYSVTLEREKMKELGQTILDSLL